MMLVSTAEAAEKTGLSELELRDGFKKGRYPALLIGKGEKNQRLRWDIGMLEESVKKQMLEIMKENQVMLIEGELE